MNFRGRLDFRRVFVDVRLINPFIDAADRVFNALLGIRIKPAAPYAARRTPPLLNRVTVRLSMRGGASGLVLLQFPRDFVNTAAGILYGTGASNDDGLDLIGEVANMIAGGAKRCLSDTLVEISVPSIILGPTRLDLPRNAPPWLVVPFDAPMGRFELAVCLVVPGSVSPSEQPSTTSAPGR